MSALAFLLVAAGQPAGASSAAQKNKALARRVFDDILNKDKYDVFAEIYAESFVKHVDRIMLDILQQLGYHSDKPIK